MTNRHGHFIEKCACGTVVAQCKCYDLNKRVVVSAVPCSHKLPVTMSPWPPPGQ